MTLAIEPIRRMRGGAQAQLMRCADDDFDSELERLFRERVSVPRTARTGVIETTAQWIRRRIEDVFRRRRLLDLLQRKIRAEEFTGPGDPTRLDYGYRFNGTRGYMQIVPGRYVEGQGLRLHRGVHPAAYGASRICGVNRDRSCKRQYEARIREKAF
jgi:hypothetical protein